MTPKSENIKPKSSEIDLEFLKVQYQVLSERRINHNTLLWNVPSLLFVAQTFLWTLALNDKANLIIRCGISILSIIVAYVSFQLFERNRFMEVIDSEQLYSIEKYISNHYHDTNTPPVMIVHNRLKERNLIDGRYETIPDFVNYHSYYKHHNKKRCLCQQVSTTLWKMIFIATILLSFLIFSNTVIQIPEFITSLQ